MNAPLPLMASARAARSRRKGMGAQREIANLLRDAGFEVIITGYQYVSGPDLQIAGLGTAEVKRRARGYSVMQGHLGDNAALFVRDDRCEWMVVQRLPDWLKRFDRAGGGIL